MATYHLSAASSLSLTLILFLAINSSRSLACNSDDKAALLAIKNSFPPNSFPQSWSSTTGQDCCHWDYIRCGKASGRVRSININNTANLAGTIPPSIGDLPFLEVLTLDTLPNLAGPIPSQLSKLTRLQQLTISSTNVSGHVPSFLPNFAPSIKHIILYNNKLTGTIPVSLDLSQFAQLTIFNVASNQLTGTIPPLFYHKPKQTFELIALSNNMLTGDIPLSFANVLVNAIYLNNNMLTANSAYVLFGESKQLTNVDFSNNLMSFNFSNLVFPKSLLYLDVSHNNIYGSIPEQITEVTDIGNFDVSYNDLCGMIPDNATFIYSSIYFQNNKCLCGTPLPPCTSN